MNKTHRFIKKPTKLRGRPMGRDLWVWEYIRRDRRLFLGEAGGLHLRLPG